ncbi:MULTISPECIES: NAD(P)/FAD-dependent oxidoreductase [Streptomyces]|uniref:Putative monooxygenase n=1 Tax=Streptomyces griseoruber TaxID=1943 RepID=Q67G35_9ACTN|nr:MULTISPECIES: NAD(P)/FAD-dependent oxidoreductase [Streptomyces]AAP85357.1 putative monooxygenase [Streptomyces griseoruber]MBH5129542.1 FAD-dependent monooxygenase [Streptomyces sp. HB-N217]QPM92746.1 monooxygenase [Streptomyces sp.]
MTRALVVGGGIAGPVAAIALQKAGLDPVVYEAFPRTADTAGNFMNIAPNGLDALACVGLAEPVRRLGFTTPAIAFYRADGRRLTEDVPVEVQAGPGAVIQTLRRADLYRTLREEVSRRGIPVEYGRRLVDARASGGRVSARFADGTHAEGELLVGADGIRSRVRKVIDRQAPDPRYLGTVNAFGVAPGQPLRGRPGVLRMYFGRRSFFMSAQHPDGDVWWFANPPRPAEPDAAELRRPDERWQEEFVELFRQDGMPAVDIVRASTQFSVPSANYDLPRVPHWQRDGMVLVGDAAHAVSPTAGQGGSVAMEDAVVLAKCVRDAPGVDAALAAYERVRRARVERIVAQGKRNVDGNLSGPLGRVVRDFFIRRAFRDIAVKGPERSPVWMLGHHIDWDTPEAAAPGSRRAGTGR